MKARFTKAAEEEVREARKFYRARSRQARAGFNAALRRSVALLCEQPLAGKLVGGTARKYVMPGAYPFSLIYHVNGESIVISAVSHQSRHPEHWHDRYPYSR